MLPFLLKRLFQALIVMLVVALVAFSLFRYVGDPINNMVGEEVGNEYRQQLREELGLSDPILVQFTSFVQRIAVGDFGVSFRNAVPVSELLMERLPATLELVMCATILALLIGIPFGVYSGIHRRGLLTGIVQVVSLAGLSLPSFVVGILLILLFSVQLGWLPSYGRGEVVKLGDWSTGLLTLSGLKSLILPSITLGLFQMTLIMRLVRAEMLEVLRTDYIKFSRARGLSDKVIHFKLALKNTLIPVVTIMGLQIGSLIAFAIVTETVFQWPGMGLLFIQAINFGDVPVMACYLVLISLMFVAINLIVDLLYYAIDPRLDWNSAAAGGHAK
jgi:ABC-type dipeptide/oligopeptide/nickel transport systems, permease components